MSIGMRRGVLTGLLLLWLPLAQLYAEPEVEPPQQVIQQVSEALKVILETEGERMRQDPAYVYQLANEVLVPHIDFAKVSSLVLGKYWRRASDVQQAAFTREFQRLLVRTYSTAFHELGDWEVRYLNERVANQSSDRRIRTQILRQGGEPLEVLYRMHLIDGSWKAYDVKIDGISLVTNYRSSFTKEARRLGMDGLISKITALNDRRSQRVPGSS